MGKNSFVDEFPTGTEVNEVAGKNQFGGGNAVLGPGVDAYFPITGSEVGSTTHLLPALAASVAGSVSKLTVWVDVPPGAGQSFTLTFMKNDVPQLLQIVITGAAQVFAVDNTNEIFFTATDLICIKATNSILSAVTRFNFGMLNIIP